MQYGQILTLRSITIVLLMFSVILLLSSYRSVNCSPLLISSGVIRRICHSSLNAPVSTRAMFISKSKFGRPLRPDSAASQGPGSRRLKFVTCYCGERKILFHYRDITDIAANVVQLCSAHRIPSLEPNVRFAAPAPTKFASCSLSFNPKLTYFQ